MSETKCWQKDFGTMNATLHLRELEETGGKMCRLISDVSMWEVVEVSNVDRLGVLGCSTVLDNVE